MDSSTLRLWILVVGLVVVAAIYGWGKFQERRTRRNERIEPAVGTLHGNTDDDWEVIPILTERRRIEPADAGADPIPRRAAEAREDAAPLSEAPAEEPSREPVRTRARAESGGQIRQGEAAPGQAAGEARRATVSHEPLAATAVAEPPVKAAPSPAPARPKELILTLSVIAPRSHQFSGPALAQALEKAGMVYGDMHIYHAPADLLRPDGPVLFSLANILEPGTLEPERLRLLETPGVVLFAQLPGAVRGMEVFDHMKATGRFLARELEGELCDETRSPLTPEKEEEIRARIVADVGDAIRKRDF